MSKDPISIATLGSQLYKSIKARARGATVFLGAGASISSGIRSWEALCREVCADYSLVCKDAESPIETMMRFLGDETAGLERYETLSGYLHGKTPSRGYHHLAQLVATGYVSTIFTTNWDCLLEEALYRQISPDRVQVLVRGLIPDDNIADVLDRDNRSMVTIVKLHGDLATRYFFIKPNEVRHFGDKLNIAIQSRMQNLTYIVGASSSDVDVLRVLLSTNGRSYLTVFDEAQKNEIHNLLRLAGIQQVSGRQKVITRNSTEVNIGDFDHFFAQLNLQVCLKKNEESKEKLIAAENQILSKEKIGLRYINNGQINDQLDLFWKKIERFSPQCIVFINDPQAPGGQELKRRLMPRIKAAGILIENITISGKSSSRSFEREVRNTIQPFVQNEDQITKVLVLDAITFSGNTLQLAKKQVEQWYPSAIVKCGVLVISRHMNMKNESLAKEIIHEHVTERFEIFFPWGVTQTTSDFDREFECIGTTRKIKINKRPWGVVEQLADEEHCSVRLLVMEANTKLSFQRHLCRDELYVALDDNIGLQIAGFLDDIETIDEYDNQIKSLILEKGDYVLIPRGVWHRPHASMDRARILEIGFGVYDQQYDIERLFDQFGRQEQDGAK